MNSYDLKWCLKKALTTPNGSGLIVMEFLENGSALCEGIVSGLAEFEKGGLVQEWISRPTPKILFKNGFKLDFWHGQNHGNSLRGMRPKTFVAAESALSPRALDELLRASSDPACEEIYFSFPKMAAFAWGFILASDALSDLPERILKGMPDDENENLDSEDVSPYKATLLAMLPTKEDIYLLQQEDSVLNSVIITGEAEGWDWEQTMMLAVKLLVERVDILTEGGLDMMHKYGMPSFPDKS